jgi:hypothetical protein
VEVTTLRIAVPCARTAGSAGPVVVPRTTGAAGAMVARTTGSAGAMVARTTGSAGAMVARTTGSAGAAWRTARSAWVTGPAGAARSARRTARAAGTTRTTGSARTAGCGRGVEVSGRTMVTAWSSRGRHAMAPGGSRCYDAPLQTFVRIRRVGPATRPLSAPRTRW